MKLNFAKFFGCKTEAAKHYTKIKSNHTLNFVYDYCLIEPFISKAIYETNNRQHHIMIFSDNSMLNFVVKDSSLIGVKLGNDYKMYPTQSVQQATAMRSR